MFWLLLALLVGYLLGSNKEDVWEMPSRFQGLFPLLQPKYFWGFTHQDLAKLDLKKKVVIITGANSGLGFATAVHCASRGATVWVSCRSEKKAEDTCSRIKDLLKRDDLKLKSGVVELSSFRSIESFVEKVKKEETKIDSLILNAGVVMPDFQTTEEGLESQMGVNHVGHFYLTSLLLPLLYSDSTSLSSVVVVGSANHFTAKPERLLDAFRTSVEEQKKIYSPSLQYSQSKLANLLFTRELAERNSEKNLIVNCIHPGAVATDAARHILQDLHKSLKFLSMETLEWMFKYFSSAFLWKPEDAALSLVHLAFSEQILTSKTSGEYFHPIANRAKPSRFCQLQQLQKELWEETEKFISTKNK